LTCGNGLLTSVNSVLSNLNSVLSNLNMGVNKTETDGDPTQVHPIHESWAVHLPQALPGNGVMVTQRHRYGGHRPPDRPPPERGPDRQLLRNGDADAGVREGRRHKDRGSITSFQTLQTEHDGGPALSAKVRHLRTPSGAGRDKRPPRRVPLRTGGGAERGPVSEGGLGRTESLSPTRWGG
jgi:hypothetical protein